MKEVFIKSLVVIAGSLLMGFGIGLTALTNLGSDPLASFWLGISNIIPISVGQANIMVAVLMMIYPLVKDKSQIGFGTLMSPLMISVAVDSILSLNLNLQSFTANLIFIIAGFMILSIGAALYISADFGKSSYDACLIILSEKLSIGLGKMRSLGDLTLFILAVILGVRISLGPVLAILIIGPMLGYSLSIINRFKERYSKSY